MEPMTISQQEVLRDAFETTFIDIQPMLKALAYRFIRKYGGHFDDAFSDAQAAFVDIYINNGFDPSRGKSFKAWVYYKAHMSLIDLRKVGWRRPKAELTPLIPGKEDFPLDEWIGELNEDGQTLIRLILEGNPSEECLGAIQSLIEGNNVEAGAKKIRRYARHALRQAGWDGHRINQAFRSIKAALN